MPRVVRRTKKNGSRTKTKPGVGYFRECPLCPWSMSSMRKQNEPQRYAETVRICPQGHRIY